MNAQALNCPTCGASISSDATVCRYCGTRLATIACPKCFGMMFVGSKFCPHCGTRAEKPVEIGPALPCPGCNLLMKQITLKDTPLQECPACFGLWVDGVSFERICADRERQVDVLGSSVPKPTIFPSAVRYRPCPQCGQLMNRFNFGNTSGVIIDKCSPHGVWFDRNELQRVVDFLHSGGMDLARQRDWERERQKEFDRRIQAGSQSITTEDDNSVGWILRMIADILRYR